MNPLLYGHSEEERVVAVRHLSDSTMRLYKREDEKTIFRDAEFFPFFFLADDTLLAEFPRKHWLKELAGTNYYRYIAAFEKWSDMWDAVHYAIRTHNKNRSPHARTYQDLQSLLLRPDPVNQFLLQSGMTLFKGMEFHDLRRVQLDVQRVSAEPGRRRKERPKTGIASITIRSNDGKVQTLETGVDSEEAVLRASIVALTELDPDVVEGFNLFGHALTFFAQRCESLGVAPTIGRDETELKHIGSEQSPLYEIPGRHCIDTRAMVEAYDFSKRDIPSLDLAELAQFFGFAKPEKISPAPKKLSKKKSAPKRSALNTEYIAALSEMLSPSSFHLTQMVAFNFGTIARNGSSAKIESLLLREYIRQKYSIPHPQQGTQTVGGYTDIFWTGVFSSVVHADVESLYPSIMLSANIKPRTDELNVMLPLLGELRTLRLETKRAMKAEENAAQRSKLDAMQAAFKILINSFYGYLAYSKALFNDYDRADEVTTTGQKILKEIIQQMELFNARILEVDTDGLFFLPPENVVGEQNEEQFVQRISTSLPLNLNLVVAGKFPKMMSYKKKNYALLDEHHNLILRGSSLSARSTERFLQHFMRRCIECLVTEDITRLHHTYASFRTRIAKHEWGVMDFCRTETVSDSIENYAKQDKETLRQKSPAYEAAMRANLYLERGETIAYYITGTSGDVKLAEASRIAEDWDPNQPDENSEYYLTRLQETAERFRIFFERAHFEHIFSADDLFGFSPEGITILNKRAGEEEKPEGEAEFGIWLEE